MVKLLSPASSPSVHSPLWIWPHLACCDFHLCWIHVACCNEGRRHFSFPPLPPCREGNKRYWISSWRGRYRALMFGLIQYSLGSGLHHQRASAALILCMTAAGAITWDPVLLLGDVRCLGFLWILNTANYKMRWLPLVELTGHLGWRGVRAKLRQEENSFRMKLIKRRVGLWCRGVLPMGSFSTLRARSLFLKPRVVHKHLLYIMLK